ncbi:response regulator [Amycolatopsis saalfeldensis]|uniref:DNA-binding response regulator, NarL/FixJ family, contains REC and HTH domains n=1 Tax=Amycolatopsis saalfeldensis TaxID=394193 RepID=A0A1H8YL61_9PSEU|nr:response regulator transcription factor [Amycolatopsis saalfeldensis]SEP52833.1 DNA-binding response regulator, NarL/FixJ family, contains REC and HTH domains [Amycolatopsis saalfeldensis]
MIKVLLLDDEALVRSGIRMILESDPEIRVVAEAGDGEGVAELVERHRPDVVLTDIQMPRVDGLEVTRVVAAGPGAPQVVVLTTFDLDEYVHTALRHGATGFLLKDTPPRDLVRAVHLVKRGEAMLAPSITRRLLAHFAAGEAVQGAKTRLEVLTPREREVAVAVAHGSSNAAIAAALGLSEATVKVHVGRIMSKVDATNRTQVAILVHDAGLA